MKTSNNNQQTTGLQTFFNDGINAGIRMKMIDGESWFIAKDICCALGLQDVSMTVKRLDDDEKLIQTLFVSGQGRETWTVNESGLYGLIFLSRKPEAKAFRKWVTNEVLPSIPSYRRLLRSSGTASDAPCAQVPSGFHRLETGCVPLSQSE